MLITGADKAIGNLMKWSARDEWSPLLDEVFAEHFDEICDHFGMTEQEIADELGDAFGMIYGWALEDFFSTEFDEGFNVIDDYLKRRGWREKVPAKRYLQALRDSMFSLYEVVDADPGRSMTVRDLIFGGDAVRVNEMSGSQSVHKWDRIAARIVTVNNKTYFTGSLLPFQHEAADELLSAIDRIVKRAGKDLRREAKKQGETADFKDADLKKMILGESPHLFTRIWLATTLERMAAPLPEIRNTDGHEIVLSEVRFPIKAEVSKIAAALDEIEEFDQDDPDGWRWTWHGVGHGHGSPAKRDSQDEGITLRTDDGSGSTVLGDIEIKGDMLVLNSNSKERAEFGRDILLSRLDDLVGPPLMSLQTLEKSLEGQDRGSPRKDEGQDEIPPEVAKQVIQNYYDGHYRKSLDEPLPYLDGKSPRQAIRTKKGREDVVAWLKLLENSEARRASGQGQQPYDFLWMWKELKVDDLR